MQTATWLRLFATNSNALPELRVELFAGLDRVMDTREGMMVDEDTGA